MKMLDLLPRAVRRHLVVARMRRPVVAFEQVEVHVVSTPEEMRSAAMLIHDSYAGRGLIAKHPSGIRVTPHSVLPSTVTFVATAEGSVVGTISLIVDSPLGLPMEAVYPSEVADVRAASHRIAEVGGLAVRPEYRGHGVACLLHRIMWQTALRSDVDRLLIAIHPEAEVLFETAMLFRRIGPERAYPGLNRSALAIGMMQDIRAMDADSVDGAHDPALPLTYYTAKHIPHIRVPNGLLGWAARARRAEIVAPLVRRRIDVFKELPAPRIAYLRSVLPSVMWPSHSEVERTDFEAWGRAAFASSV